MSEYKQEHKYDFCEKHQHDISDNTGYSCWECSYETISAMIDERRKLTSENAELREKVVGLEKDDTRKWDMMNADGVTLDRYRTALAEIVVGYKAFNDHSGNYEQLTIAIIKGAALLNGKEPDLSAFEMIDRMEPVWRKYKTY